MNRLARWRWLLVHWWFVVCFVAAKDIGDNSCGCYHRSGVLRNDNEHNNENENVDNQEEARIAYLVTVHNRRTVDDALPLFRSIRYPRNIIMIHMDTKMDPAIFENSALARETQDCHCGARVHVDSVHSAEWSTWSMNDPTFWGMEIALTKFRNEWDVFVNLSGDTMPVFTPNVIARQFGGPLRGINFVTSSSCETGFAPTNVYVFPKWWHKRGHYTTNPDGDPIVEHVLHDDDDGGGPSKQEKTRLVIHFGSQWMALQPSFVEYLVTSLRRPDSLPSRFRDELIRTQRLMTDETFIPTLLMHVHPFNETLPVINDEDGSLLSQPNMMTLRYERMDEHVPTAFGYYPIHQRYEVPESSVADQPKPWGPYFLGVYDLADIKASGALYIRKVSVEVDPNLVNLLPVSDADELPEIAWPKEVRISDVPDWSKKLKQLRESMDEEEEEEEEEEQEEETDVKDL